MTTANRRTFLQTSAATAITVTAIVPVAATRHARREQVANISTRVGRSINFDPVTEQVIGDEEANRLVRREYREHWGTPKGASART